MEVKEILSKCDHTLLSQTATWEEIRALCDDGIRYGCASVCITYAFVRRKHERTAVFFRCKFGAYEVPFRKRHRLKP